MRKIKIVCTNVSENFYRIMNEQRKEMSKKLNIKKKISIPEFTEMAYRGGLKFPDLRRINEKKKR